MPATTERFADEAVVAVKPRADEDVVTHQRIKLSVNDEKKNVGGEGRNTEEKKVQLHETVFARSATGPWKPETYTQK